MEANMVSEFDSTVMVADELKKAGSRYILKSI